MTQMQTSIHGREFGLDTQRRAMSPRGFVAGEHGNQIAFPSPTRVVQFDDFLGDTINTDLYSNPTKGSDGATVDFAIVQDISGKLRGTTGAGAGASMAINGIQISGGLNWRASQGGLSMQARVQTAAISTLCYYVGFTDQVSSLEMPFTISGDVITSNATDAVGILYDTAATASTFKLLGVKNDVDTLALEASKSATNLTTAPVAATWVTLRVSLSSAGAASFFIDGLPVGGANLPNAVSTNIPLAPVVAVFRRSAASTTMDIDYLAVEGNRV